MSGIRASILALAFFCCGLAVAEDVPLFSEELIELVAKDQVKLGGTLLVPDAAQERPVPTVILLHAFGRNRDKMTPLADALVAKGFAVAALDLRGHGTSNLRTDNSIVSWQVEPIRRLHRAVDDLHRTVAHLDEDPRLDTSRLGVVGVLQGGLIALEEASQSVRIKALVVVDPPQALAGFEPTRDLGLYGARPALLVCSKLPRSRDQAGVLAEYGSGERTVRCVDDYEEVDGMLRRNSPATREVVQWLSEKLLSEAPAGS